MHINPHMNEVAVNVL